MVSRIEIESPSIKSFYLSPRRGDAPPFRAGQHLPIRVPLKDNSTLVRTYGLSRAPGRSELRITVKREESGRGSKALHDSLGQGDRLYAMEPAGEFWLDNQSSRPVALVSAGVGITPLLSMWQHLAEIQPEREVFFVHGAREGREHILREEVEQHCGDARRVHFRYSIPAPEDRFHSVGHVDLELLQNLFPVLDYDFYICGPAGFLKSLHHDLILAGVPKGRIHLETFGSLSQTQETAPSTVEFVTSQSSAVWRGGTLLELAETANLRPVYSCRAGPCGECRARLLSGSIEYVRKPSYPVLEGEVLLCSARPSSERLRLDV